MSEPSTSSSTGAPASSSSLELPTAIDGQWVSSSFPSKTVESRLPTSSGASTPGVARKESVLLNVNVVSLSAPPPLPRVESVMVGGSDAGAGAGADLQQFPFERTLPSEMEQQELLHLLEILQQQKGIMKEFTPSDLYIISQLLTVLHFRGGDTIIEVGEASSFIALLLSGSLAVVLPSGQLPLEPGSLLGEMSYFEGGTRTAQVVATSDSILAILTFAELENIKLHAPEIRMKVMHLFAVEGIKKLRSLMDKEKERERERDRDKEKDKDKTKDDDRKDTSSFTGDRPLRKSITKAGSRRNTLTMNLPLGDASSKSGMVTPREDVASAVSGSSSKNMKKMESLIRSRLTSGSATDERKKTTVTLSPPQPTRSQALRDMADQQQTWQDERRQLERRVYNLTTQLKNQNATLAATQAELQDSNQQRDFATRSLKVLEQQMGMSLTNNAAAFHDEIKQLQDANEQLKHQMNTQLLELAALSAEKQRSEQELQAKLSAVEDERDALAARKADVEKQVIYWMSENQFKTERISELTNLVGLQTEAANKKAEEFAEFQGAHNQLRRVFLSTADRLAISITTCQSYKKILKRALFVIFAKTCRRRSSLASLLQQCQTMTFSLRSELLRANTASTTPSIAESPNVVVRRRKARPSIDELITQLSEAVLKLKPMVDNVIEQKVYWHNTSNSFFERTIELKQQIDDLQADTRRSHTSAEGTQTQQQPQPPPNRSQSFSQQTQRRNSLQINRSKNLSFNSTPGNININNINSGGGSASGSASNTPSGSANPLPFRRRVKHAAHPSLATSSDFTSAPLSPTGGNYLDLTRLKDDTIDEDGDDVGETDNDAVKLRDTPTQQLSPSNTRDAAPSSSSTTVSPVPILTASSQFESKERERERDNSQSRSSNVPTLPPVANNNHNNTSDTSARPSTTNNSAVPPLPILSPPSRTSTLTSPSSNNQRSSTSSAMQSPQQSQSSYRTITSPTSHNNPSSASLPSSRSSRRTLRESLKEPPKDRDEKTQKERETRDLQSPYAAYSPEKSADFAAHIYGGRKKKSKTAKRDTQKKKIHTINEVKTNETCEM